MVLKKNNRFHKEMNIMKMDSAEGFVDLDRLETISAAEGDSQERSPWITVSTLSLVPIIVSRTLTYVGC